MNHQEIATDYVKTFKKSEEDFIKAIQDAGKVTSANDNENMFEHWDVKLQLRFDVKSIKKISRDDDVTNESIHWIELLNINGKHGWLYGKADYFSFESNDYWILISRENLQRFIADRCKEKEWCKEPSLYKLYRREGRKDAITLVKTIDLIYICDKMIKKNNI